jgi:hypothetical protein
MSFAGTKADFVRAAPESMPPKLVVAAARRQGLSIALGYVYQVRGPSPVRLTRKPLAPKSEGGQGLPGHVSAQTAFLHAVLAGPGTTAELVGRVRRVMGGNAMSETRAQRLLDGLDHLGYVRRDGRYRAGRCYRITTIGAHVAKGHRDKVLGLQGGRRTRTMRFRFAAVLGAPGYLDGKTAFLHALVAGHGTVAELLARVRSVIESASVYRRQRAAHILSDLELVGYACGFKQKPTRSPSAGGGRWPYAYRITPSGRRVALRHRAVILALQGGHPQGLKRTPRRR